MAHARHAVTLRTLAAVISLLLCAKSATAAGPAPTVVLQIGHQAPVRAVLWTADSRHLFSLAQDGSIVVWDLTRNVPGGVVIDHASVPWPEKTRVLAFTANRGETARITLKVDPNCREVGIGAWRDRKNGQECSNSIGPNAGNISSYDINLATREVTAAPVTETATPAGLFPLSPDGRWGVVQNHGSGENGILDPQDEHIEFREADCTSRTRCRYGVNLFMVDQSTAGGVATNGIAGCFNQQVKVILPNGQESTGAQRVCNNPKVAMALTGKPRSYFFDMDLSRDGRRLLRLESIRNELAARVQLLDINDSSASSSFSPEGAFHRIEMLDGGGYALFSHGFDATNDVVEGGIPPVMLVNPACSANGVATNCARIPAHGLMRPLDNGAFVGVGSIKDCFRATKAVGDIGPDGVWCLGGEELNGEGFRQWPQLQFYSGSWAGRAVPELAGYSITAIEVARNQHSIAVAARSTAPGTRTAMVMMLDASPKIPVKVIWRGTEPAAGNGSSSNGPAILYLAFDPDGRQLLFDFDGNLVVVDTTGVQAVRQVPFDRSLKIVTDGHHAFGLATGALVDLDTGKKIALRAGTLLKAGFIEGKPVLWTATTDGVVQFWHSATGAQLMTLYSFTDNRFFAVTPDGRYDTNLTPDANEVRWLMADAPWQSLAAQTFMRDYYEPRLVSRKLACTAANKCATEFQPLPQVSQVNRVLPHVEIRSVVPGTKTGTVDVCVAARSMEPEADSGQTKPSGLHDLRLFRDGRLIAERGAPPGDLNPRDIGKWSAATTLPDQFCPDPASVFTVAVPQNSNKPVTFTAYALNSDRVKGDTSPSVSYQAPMRAAPRTPRAYVIAIGVNDYVNIPEKSLHFAVNDAQAVTSTLRSIPGHEVVTMELTSEPGRNQATKAQIRAAFASLQQSTPEDVVIITFSGHGVADAQGRFFLLPSDATWRGGDAQSDWATMISSGELTEWLRDVDAADIALVIDACHSAASVAAGEFKPGPMGDPGLGQLAYDKGVRILAATQGDDVALEDDRLRQGLLTFALTGNDEALGKGNSVTLDAWLRYAAKRIPSLAEDVRVGKLNSEAGGTRGFTLLNATPAKKPQVQEPSLFDFTGQPSKVVLKGTKP